MSPLILFFVQEDYKVHPFCTYYYYDSKALSSQDVRIDVPFFHRTLSAINL